MVDSSVDAGLATLARDTWSRYLDAFAAREGCIGQVRLAASYDLADRASYDPFTRTATLKVPATPAMLQSAMIHEWAHHLEYFCPQQVKMRDAFLAAQGLPHDTHWSDAHSATSTGQERSGSNVWAALPSEQFAEAAVEVVLGSRAIPTAAQVRPGAVRVVAEWAAGR